MVPPTCEYCFEIVNPLPISSQNFMIFSGLITKIFIRSDNMFHHYKNDPNAQISTFRISVKRQNCEKLKVAF